MDHERLLITKCSMAGLVDKFLVDGIREEHFVTEESREIWAFMVDHAKQYKTPPSHKVVQQRFPAYNFEVSPDSAEYLKDVFQMHAMRNSATETLRSLAEAVEDDTKVRDIDALFLEAARSLAQEAPHSRVGRYSDAKQRIAEYHQRKKDGVEPGIFMGIPKIDALTLGIQPHEFISVVGWQGTGKSTLAQWILYCAARRQGKVGMYFSLEMGQEALFRKWDCMEAGIDYHRLKSHELDASEMARWEAAADDIAKGPGDIITLDDVRSCTPDKVYAEIARWAPDIAVIDYVSLMDTPRSTSQEIWQKVTYLTQNLKAIARNIGVPIIGVAQTNIDSADAGAKLSNIAYSRSIGQDSDIVLGLFQDEGMKEQKQMQVRLLKNRDGANANADMFWNMKKMHFEEWNEALHMFKGPGANAAT